MKRILTIFFVLLLVAGGAYLWFYGPDLEELANRELEKAQAEQAKMQPPPPPMVVVQEPEPLPPPPAKPEPPKPKPRPIPAAHSAEHAVALRVAQAAAPQAAPDELEALVQGGSLSAEDAQTLRDWAKEHPNFKVEEVGIADARQPGGEKETRYRLVSADGGQDLLVSVSTPKQGKPVVHRVEAASSDRTQVSAQSDAISVVEGFVEALKRGDMGTARRLTSGGDISDATLAGLCIMFEEGDFSMRKKLPIRNMFKNEASAGYIIYMAPHDESGEAGNVGVELGYDAQKGWVVKAVAMDSLLNRYETSGAAEGGVYFPLVKNPQGGDSLVLYFGFNDATPSPRSLSQLKIVANLLKGSQGKLNISGHTDDVGTAEYNMQLSERRAAAVRDSLIANGVSESQITTQGLGKSQPRRTYQTGDSRETIRTIRSGNRRAEIYLDF